MGAYEAYLDSISTSCLKGWIKVQPFCLGSLNHWISAYLELTLAQAAGPTADDYG